MKISRKGFTLAELLIVVAIIAVLVAVAIPIFGSQLEKSREAADLANVRAAYAKVLTEANMGNYDKVVTVDLKQKQNDWQSADIITIGGISHSVKEGDTANWIGKPGAGGQCKISFDQEKGTKFVWSGNGTSAPNSYDMSENFFNVLTNSGCLELVKNNTNFEFDSGTDSQTYVPKIKAKIGANSLLQTGTWAYLGSEKEAKERYLFWTSLDINAKGEKAIAAGTKIPILIQRGDGKYYVSQSKVASRNGKYMAIADHLSQKGYQDIIAAGDGYTYNTLSEAYAAYEKKLENDYKDLPK